MRELLAFDLAQASRPSDDPWWRVAEGELSPEGLVAERRGIDGADDSILRQRAELYAPPSAEEHARQRNELVVRFFAEAGESGAEGSAGSPASGSAGAKSEASSPGGVVSLDAERRRRRPVLLGALVAVAAAVLLTWVLASPGGPAGEPMPGFAPEWSNQYTGSMRSEQAAEGCQRYKSDGRLHVLLRPQVAVADDLVVAALARSAAGEVRRLAIDPTLSAAGVITVDQPVDALGLWPGRWTVSFFVSRSGSLDQSALAELEPGEHPEIAVIRSEVCIEG